MIKPNVKKALFLAKKQLPSLVCDAINLEGINMTLPEVQTLLEGITVGGHSLSEQTITLNQAAAWKHLFNAVANEQFCTSQSFACHLHSIAAKNEALEWGCFRSGGVTISGTNYLPPKTNTLNERWLQMIETMSPITDVFEQAIYLFLQMARNQFFYDVNKRMGRFMMNGLLLSQGYPAINLPANRKLEFNKLMLNFYPTGDITDMTAFMKSCQDPTITAIMSE